MTWLHRIAPGSRVRLTEIDPAGTGPFADKEAAREAAAADLARLADLQQRLYAERKHSVLIVLQAMDTAGKDGVIRKVVGPLDARGLHVWSFAAPSVEERGHDFLWRVHARSPHAGEIAVFNRSHYEDVLVVRVMELCAKERWSRRYDHINAFEAMLAAEGTTIVKLFLHISKDEQARRLQSRLDDPDRRWKFDPVDLEMRKHWDDFQHAYEDVLTRCSTEHAPWHVIPSDHKWYRDAAVARILADTLDGLAPRFPEVTFDAKDIRVR